MDQFDRAAELEVLHREAALSRQFAKTRTAAVSAFECEACGEPIPEQRRIAVPGCRHCIDCQEDIERYGKTRFA